MLRTYTIGDINPIGKPRVYFCARREDYGYLNSVVSNIFQVANVAIYYDDEQNTENTSTQELLEMNMIVLILTPELLSAPSDAMNRIFALAVKHNIPLMILGMHENVGFQLDAFCQANGLSNRHVIFPNIQDESGHSFLTKLKDFMNNHVIMGHSFEKVHEHFDGHVFLSYRKVDKPLASKVIRMLNQANDCLSYALWFDEYLTVGEDFDEEIQHFIDASDVFLLLVTEKMLEKGSYALEKEYFRAVSSQKQVIILDMIQESHALPAELANENNMLLPYHAIAKLPGLLRQLLGARAHGSKQEFAEHLYYLGLAYRHGIAKERSEEIAIDLIREATLSGNLDACDTMVEISMENSDISSAIEYQTLLMNQRREAFDESPTCDNLASYLTALSVLGEYQGMGGHMAEMKQCHATIVSILDNTEGWANDPRLLEHAIISNDKLGSFAMLQIPRAEDRQEQIQITQYYYKRCFDLAQLFARMENSLKARRFLYTPMMRLADILYDYYETPLEEVLKQYQEILPLMEDADRIYHTHETRRDLGGIYQTLTKLSEQLGLDCMLPYGLKWLEYTRQAYLESKTLECCEKYADAMEGAAKLQYEAGLLEDAIRNLNKATKARHTCIEESTRARISFDRHLTSQFYDYINVCQMQVENQNPSECLMAITFADRLIAEYREKLFTENNLKNLAERHLTLGTSQGLFTHDQIQKELRLSAGYYKILYDNFGKREYANAWANIAELLE